MACFSNTTTTRLEAFARARGLDGFGVLADRQNSAGVFFCTRLDGKVLSRWISLGWTRAEAKEAIERMAADEPQAPSSTGYVSYA